MLFLESLSATGMGQKRVVSLSISLEITFKPLSSNIQVFITAYGDESSIEERLCSGP